MRRAIDEIIIRNAKLVLAIGIVGLITLLELAWVGSKPPSIITIFAWMLLVKVVVEIIYPLLLLALAISGISLLWVPWSWALNNGWEKY